MTFRTAMSHLARGDEPDHPLTDEQAVRLDERVADLRRARIGPLRVHLANSAAAQTRPDLSRDLVRTSVTSDSYRR